MSFLPSRPRRSFLRFRSSFNFDSLNPAFEELSCHVAKGHPLDAFMFVDVIDDSEDISVLASQLVSGEHTAKSNCSSHNLSTSWVLTKPFCGSFLSVFLKQQSEIKDEFFACGPGWRCIALWLFASEVGYDFDRLGEDVSLLFFDFGQLLGKGFDCVSGCTVK
ncbi:hypothetical protein KCU83_g188, partial [Aureobasidium melanogenum]